MLMLVIFLYDFIKNKVRATDRDEGNNASITYSFISNDDSDDDGAFNINPATGVITTTKVCYKTFY